MQAAMGGTEMGLEAVGKLLDEENAHLLDQSRGIDVMREKLTGRRERLRAEGTVRLAENNRGLARTYFKTSFWPRAERQLTQ